MGRSLIHKFSTCSVTPRSEGGKKINHIMIGFSCFTIWGPVVDCMCTVSADNSVTIPSYSQAFIHSPRPAEIQGFSQTLKTASCPFFLTLVRCLGMDTTGTVQGPFRSLWEVNVWEEHNSREAKVRHTLGGTSEIHGPGQQDRIRI